MPFKNYYSPRNLFVVGLAMMMAGLPLSVFLMSFSQLVMGIAWFWDGDLKTKLNRFKEHKSALLMVVFFLLHVLGLLYSSNIPYALFDLRIKLPLLTMPFLLASFGPLSKETIRKILLVFILSVFTATLISTGVLTGIIHHKVNDIRDISIFISHIRFSLLILVCIFLLINDLSKQKPNLLLQYKALHYIFILWFIFFLFLLQSATGIIILSLISYLIGIQKSFNMNGYKKWACLTLLFLLPLLSLVTIEKKLQIINSKFQQYSINYPTRTANGNVYENYPEKKDTENGYPLWISLCMPELHKEWNKRSTIDFNGKDARGQNLQYTLVRYMTSKGLRKDSTGFSTLSDQEIRAIEKGITNVSYTGALNFNKRFTEILWELNNYSEGGNPSGHSITQRFEFWKTSVYLWMKHPIIGVGTGDVEDTFKEGYVKLNSRLDVNHRLHAHNQYLMFAVTFGILGLLYFLLVLFYPFVEKRNTDFIFKVYFLILLLSMLTEDTLETQPGATFFAFLFCFFLYSRSSENKNQSLEKH